MAKVCALTQPGPVPGSARSPGTPARRVSARCFYLPETHRQCPLGGLRSIPLLLVESLLMGVIALVLFESQKPFPEGLLVRLLRPGVEARRTPGIQQLLVQLILRKTGQRPDRPDLFIDSQPVS